MSRLREERGLTMVEMIVAIVISLLVFAATMTVLDTFMNDNRNDEARNENQDNARNTIDHMSLDLRNVASPVAGAAGALEKSGDYDLIFQTVNANTTFGGSNATNQMRVRYCLATSGSLNGQQFTSSNAGIIYQTQTWTSASAPAIPSTTNCPGTVGAGNWTSAAVEVSNVTNEINSQNRPLFHYGPCGSACANPSQIKSIEVDMFLDPNPGMQPGEAELTTGLDLRNSLAPPVASFTISQVNHYVQLNASGSTDPNGQALSYQWSLNGSPISGATTQQYNAGNGFTSGTNQTFGLTVTNTGGLTNSSSQTVTIQ